MGSNMSIEEIKEYYITSNHTKSETCEYFNISERELYNILKEYNISKVKYKQNYSDISKNDLIKHLTIDCLTYQDVANLYGKSRSFIRRLCARYNISIPKSCTKTARERTNIKRYGYSTPLKNQIIQQKSQITSIERYGTKRAADSKEIRMKAAKNIQLSRLKNHTTQKEIMENELKKNIFLSKRYKTLSVNKTAGKSKEECIILNSLSSKFKNVEYQYNSDRYPFICDFYIPSLDLYIEYQGFWAHGKYNNKIYGPFDNENEEHIKLLNIWKDKSNKSEAYKHAINVWTITDPLKRKTARQNNLNWIEFFTIEEFNEWITSYKN